MPRERGASLKQPKLACLSACHPLLPPRCDTRCLLRPRCLDLSAPALEANRLHNVRSPSSRALHAARVLSCLAQTAPSCPSAHPARPSLALDPTPLSAFVRLLAQDLDDIYGERDTWLRLWMGNQPLGLPWGQHAFELIYGML